MIISYARQFVFIHIHKTGGDSIATALTPVLGRRDIALKSDFQQWLRRVAPGSDLRTAGHLRKHSPAIVVRAYLSPEQWERFYTFAFVRHPISRAVSLYSYAKKKTEERQRILLRNLWYMTPPGQVTDPLQWPSVRAYRDTDSFSDFIRHPLVESEPAMRPQWQSVCDESQTLLVDFVGRFERLAEDFEVVQRRLDIPRRSLPWRNSSDSRSSRRLQSVTDDDRSLLAERFKDDFKLFGYDPS